MAEGLGFTLDGNTRPSVPLDVALLGDYQTVLPWQIANSFRSQSNATILDGNTDSRFQYTVNAGTVTSGTDAAGLILPFVHGLSFVPVVDGSVYVTFDTKRRQLPFIHAGGTYGSSNVGLTISIDSIDGVYINVKIRILDGSGISFIAGTTVLLFKFFCRKEAIV